MAELRSLLTDGVGLTDVGTYIQSGNVVFSVGAATTADDASIGASISRAIADHFGFDVPVVVRDAEVLWTLLDRSAELYPDVDTGSDTGSDTESADGSPRTPAHDKRVMVGFLTAEPTAEATASIDPHRSSGDSIIVEGDHAHIHYATGQGTTKLTGDYLERILGVGMTIRNLATIRKLRDLV